MVMSRRSKWAAGKALRAVGPVLNLLPVQVIFEFCDRNPTLLNFYSTRYSYQLEAVIDLTEINANFYLEGKKLGINRLTKEKKEKRRDP